MRNGASESLITGIAAAVADGLEVDWSSAYGSVDTKDDIELLDQLRLIGHIVRTPTITPWGAPPGQVPDRQAPAERSRWGTLEIEERLGGGGFGEVFRAWDPRLERHVALKLLHSANPTNATVEPQSSVIREASLLARIRHPNVVLVYGAERIGGVDGIWMELLAGRTLASRLSQEGPCGEREAITTGIELCRALTAVHDAGLIHRDLKAANVMCEPDGRLVLMDLGSGRRQELDAAACSDLTGTPMYLAPEIFRGEAASVQSDIYSLGVLLYHVVTGTYPVTAPSALELARAHERGERTPLREAQTGLSAAFCRVVERAVSPDPRDRFNSASEMSAALVETTRATSAHFIGISTLLTAIVLVLIAAVFPRPAASATAATADPILIGAFENRTGRADLNGTVEWLLKRDLASDDAVAMVSEERVADTLRLMRRPHEPLNSATAREVAIRDGGISSYVTGHVESYGSGYVIVASLGSIDGHERMLVENARDNDDLERAVSQISRVLRQTFSVSRAVPGQGHHDAKVSTPSLAAFRLYSASLRAAGEARWNAALDLVTQAIQEDSAFASAHAWQAWCSLVLNRRDLAKAAIGRAVELAETASEPERLFILGLSREISGQRAEARAAYEAFLELRPNHYWALMRMLVLGGSDRNYAAGSLLARAADVRPTNYEANKTAAMALQRDGDLDRARHYVERARAIEAEANLPIDGWLALFPAFEYWLAGRTEDTVRWLDEQVAVNQTSDSVLRMAAEFNVALGRLDAAERTLARLRRPNTVLAALTSWLRGAQFSPPPYRSDRPLPRLDAWVWLMARTGWVEEAETLLEPQRKALRNSPGLAAMEGMLLLAEGQDAKAAPQLEAASKQMPHGQFLSIAAAEDAAVALARQGDVVRSCELLAEATKDPRRVYGNISMLVWLQARVRLLECYNAAGDLERARGVSHQLRPLLVTADPTFEPAVRFRSAAH